MELSKDQIFDLILISKQSRIHLKEFLELKGLNLDLDKIEILAESMQDKGLVDSYDNGLIIKITPLGNEIAENGGWLEHIKAEQEAINRKKENEDIEIRKSKVDLELAEKMLKEYPWTKWMARIAFIVSILLAVYQIFIKES